MANTSRGYIQGLSGIGVARFAFLPLRIPCCCRSLLGPDKKESQEVTMAFTTEQILDALLARTRWKMTPQGLESRNPIVPPI